MILFNELICIIILLSDKTPVISSYLINLKPFASVFKSVNSFYANDTFDVIITIFVSLFNSYYIYLLKSTKKLNTEVDFPVDF